jgi:hypothetical protein
LVSRVWDISLGICPCFPLAGGLCNFYVNAGGKQPMQRHLLSVHYKQQANPLLLMHNYTRLVISGNNKNKELTSRQRKLALTARNTLFAILQYKNIGAP